MDCQSDELGSIEYMNTSSRLLPVLDICFIITVKTNCPTYDDNLKDSSYQM